MPPTLGELTGGVSAVNAWLERARRASEGLGQPSHLDRRELVHGGIFHPGEVRGRAVADRVTLRYRALAHVPHLAMICALLVAHRKLSGRLALRLRDQGIELRLGRRLVGDLLFLLDEFCSEQGWLVSRRPRAGLAAAQLVAALETLGVAQRIGELVVLAEPFYVRLQSDVEEHELMERLLPLSDRLVGFVEGWSPEV